jgi:uncharacterized YccA/Bax inhibitor family protein
VSQQILNERTFGAENEARVTGGAQVTRTMTVGGTAAKAALFLAVTIVFASIGWDRAEQVLDINPIWFLVGFLVLIGLTFVAARNPVVAAPLGFIYGVLMGTYIGAISRFYEAAYDGVVGQALFCTLAVFGVTLALYGFRIVKVTNRFINTVVTATIGVLVFYLFSFVLSLFDVSIVSLTEPSPLSIGISVVISVIAAANLFVDYAYIEQGAKQGAPKQMEWLSAFGLLTTLVWLYLEILRLLSLLRGD